MNKTIFFVITSMVLSLGLINSVPAVDIQRGVFGQTSDVGQSYAVQYTNHTSDKYKIQFQYPSGWELEEKTSRFDDEDVDIYAYNPSRNGTGMVSVNILSKSTSDFKSTVNNLYETQLGFGSNTREIKSIEQPSFTTIDNQSAGTYLLTIKDTSLVPKIALQYWIVERPNGLYLIDFNAKSEIFDNAETTEIRNHFINSIKFLSVNTTQSSQPSTSNQSLTPLGNDISSDQGSGMTAKTNIKISSTNSFVDAAGYYHIVGEVENDSPVSISSVKVIATLYDSSNAVVGTDYAYTNPQDIVSGDKAPFEILVLSASIPTQQIDHYRIVPTYQ